MPGRNWLRRYIFAPNRHMAVQAALVAAGIGVILLNVQRLSPAEWRHAPAGTAGLTAISFNILLGGQPAGSALDAIEAADPDIVCLQEMTPELAKMFEARLGKLFPHRYFKPGQMTQGVGIASRHKLSGGKVLTLGLTYLPAVSATVQTQAGPIRVACVHLMPPLARFNKSVNIWDRYWRNQAIRVGQAEHLLRHLEDYHMPAIVLGDMNEWPGQAAGAVLAKAGFRDPCNAPGRHCGPTWPGQTLYWPATFRIDHILGRGINFTDAAVLEAGGSDHYPVAARFRPVAN